MVSQSLAGSPNTYYLGCDGYGPPTGSGDGMTRWALSLGFFASGGGDTRRQTPAFHGDRSIGMCGAALAHLEKFPQYWLRKVSLMRARGLHRLAAGDPKGAIADIDAAEAAAVEPDDIYYRRSLRLGAELVRALAQRELGEQAAAEATVAEALQTRPYSRQSASAALVVLSEDGDQDRLRAVLRAMGQVEPAAATILFQVAFEHGRFAEALDVYPSIGPRKRLGDTPTDTRAAVLVVQENRAEAETFWAREGGRRAYALAALGRSTEARAAMKAVHDRFAASTPDRPALPPEATTLAKTESVVYEQTNLKIRTSIPPLLAVWSELVEARCRANEGQLERAWVDFAGRDRKFEPTWATVDLLMALGAASPQRKRYAEDAGKALRQLRKTSLSEEVKALFEALPETETRQRLTAYKRNASWMGDPANGFTVTQDVSSGVTTVAFRSRKSPTPLLEDMALLKAADMAREAGKTGFLVLDSRNIAHTIVNTMYGTPINTLQDGYATQLDVVFVDLASLPEALRGSAWRVADAQAIYAALAPLYIAPAGAADRDGGKK